MYLVDTIAKDRIQSDPMVTMFVRFSDEDVAKADRLEIWGTSFNEGGSDYCDYRLMDGDTVVVSRSVAGY
jgi:hypothetical protein